MMSATSTSILGVLMVVAILGNVIIVVVLIKHRRILLRNRPTYQFILNLAVSDLVIGVLLCPFELITAALGEWIFGSPVCKIVDFVEISASGTTVITHALIAIDRYRSLAYPLLPKLKPKLVKQMIALSWLLPTVVCAPNLYMTKVVDMTHKLRCTQLAIPVLWLDRMYGTVAFVMTFLSPLCGIFWCYYRVLRITLGKPSKAQGVPTSRITLRRSQKRVTRTACMIVVTFIICWTPAFVMSMWRIVKGTDSIYQSHLLSQISFFGGLINEATNPIIYTVYDRNMNVWEYIRCRNRVANDDINNASGGTSAGLQSDERLRQSRRNVTKQLRLTESNL